MAGENGLDDSYFSDVTGTKPDTDTTVVNDTITTTTEPVDTTKPPVKDKVADVVEDKSKPAPKLDANGKPVTQPKPDQQKPDQQQQQQKPSLRKGNRGDWFDDKGNITDEQGNILYTAGRARRAYEENQRFRAERNDMIERTQRAELQLREVTYLNGVPQKFNLSNDEVATALDWAARMKRDPVSVAKDLLAAITAQGYNVTDLLGKDVGDSIDMRGIKALLDERLKPFEQQRQQASEEDAGMQEARRLYNAFLADNEFADVHEDAIANLAKRDGVSPQVSYNRLYKFAADNGLDFSMPLGPQIIERRNAQQQPDNRQQQRTEQRPLPSNAAQTRSNGAQERTPVYADPDDDWASIIARAMKTQ